MILFKDILVIKLPKLFYLFEILFYFMHIVRFILKKIIKKNNVLF